MQKMNTRRRGGLFEGEAGMARFAEARVGYAIGDVHGRADALERMFDQLEQRAESEARPGGPPLAIFLGDYVDRGPQSDRVLDLLISGRPHGYERKHLKGNHEQAIRYSQKSLNILRDVIGAAEVVSPSEASELERGEGGFLDTLAHCYAGNKDYELAVKYQTLAAEKDPHSQAIVRALARFKEKLTEARGESSGH